MTSRRIFSSTDVAILESLQSARDVLTDGEGAEKSNDEARARAVPSAYLAALSNLIPPEIVAAFLAVDGVVRASGGTVTAGMYWVIYLITVGIAALRIRQTTNEPDLPIAARQITLGTLGFVIWSYAIGGPFEFGSPAILPYNPALGGIAAILFTLVAPQVARR